MNKIFISIVVPVYNEEDRVVNLTEIFRFFEDQKINFEIIVVNDGSLDSTQELLNNLAKTIKLKIISYKTNKGKGYAIKTGMLSALGNYIIFMDVDLSTPLIEYRKFKKNLSSADVIIGTRKLKEVLYIKKQGVIRIFLGKGFTFLSKIILGINVSDFTCGFKVFSKQVAKIIFKKTTINRWGFDSEILFLAKKLDFKILEIPVNWENDPRTKVKFPQDIMSSLSDLLRILINNLTGKYI